MIIHSLYNIIKRGTQSLMYDYDGQRLSRLNIGLWFFLLPLCICFIDIVTAKCMSAETLNTVLTVLSIFTSLLFGVIFVVPEKLNTRIEKYKGQTDNETDNYLCRFRNFAKLFVNRLSLVITLCIFLIILLSALLITPDYLSIFRMVLNSISVLAFYFIVLTLLILLIDIHALLLDDIEQAE